MSIPRDGRIQPQVDHNLTPQFFWVICFVILAAAFLLRFPSLTYQSLWLDEFITLRVSQTPLFQFPLIAADVDSQPPLFYLLVKLFTMGGPTETSLRLVSALAGLATIPAIGWIAKQLSGNRAALIAMAILTFAPFHVWYSQEARSYALVLLLLTLSVGFLLRIRDGGRSSRLAWAGFVVTTALALYTHLMALPFLLVQIGVAVGAGGVKDIGATEVPGRTEGNRTDWRRILLGQAVALVIFLPEAVMLFRHAWLHYLLPPMSVFLEGPTRTYAASPGGISALILATGYGLFSLLAGFSLGPSVRELHEVSGETLSGFLTPGVVGFCLIMGLGAWLAFKALLRRDPLSVVGFMWAAVVLFAIPVAVFFAEAPFRPRYVAIAFPGLALWLTGGVSSPGTPLKRNAALLALLAGLLIPLAERHDPRYVKEDVRSAARYLSALETPRADVVVSARSVAEGLRFYLEEGSPGSALGVREYPSWGTVETRDYAEEEFRSLLSPTQSGWLLLARQWENDPKSLILAVAEQTHDVARRESWPGVQLFFLQPRTARP